MSESKYLTDPAVAASSGVSRRRFVQSTGALGLGAGVAGFPHIVAAQGANSGGSTKVLKVGLVGCGGRGTGAASQALLADPNVELWAMADAFEPQIKKSLANLSRKFSDRIKVAPARQFAGLDGYQKLMDSGVDVVLLTAPPGFRPKHLEAAVNAGKHIFAEKPMAVDMAGVKSVLASAKLAQSKGISIQHGYCWRFAPAVREAYKRVLDGELGRVISVYGNFLVSPPKPMKPDSSRKPEWSDVEWQVRNWMGFEWLSGGPLIEQAVHSIDKMAWAMGDVAPIAAVASGGRSQRQDSGNTYDHYNIAYEYPNGTICHIAQRQYTKTHSEVVDRVFCEKGRMVGPGRPMFYDAAGKAIWRYRGQNENMYQVSHNELFAAIRAGKIINTGEYMANSTALGLLGREAAHTGKRLTWKALMESDDDLAPDSLKWGDSHKVPGVPIPGRG
ncbi:Gfo/Idh/MocA family oxidoreductase [Verrucomicrobiaceae bacterium N1E253]|uniref:Gfo/Idh/MocA family oxidoreductase n=1 Tax=Oceaniferula marina TaxID=2748318 RepID=A0A851GPH0_9BACT|nr:Gfo/Idh/MocA family oxidoreductase [Oceaniferula marina]NWK56917.1 Gfo/Idh/MocA family oxidoreductase [Oceaniferula marina]